MAKQSLPVMTSITLHGILTLAVVVANNSWRRMANGRRRVFLTSNAPQVQALPLLFFSSTIGMADIWSLTEYVWNSPSMYKQWWLALVREDPGHVVVETALIAFIVYILVFKKTLNPKVRACGTNIGS